MTMSCLSAGLGGEIVGPYLQASQSLHQIHFCRLAYTWPGPSPTGTLCSGIVSDQRCSVYGICKCTAQQIIDKTDKPYVNWRLVRSEQGLEKAHVIIDKSRVEQQFIFFLACFSQLTNNSPSIVCCCLAGHSLDSCFRLYYHSMMSGQHWSRQNMKTVCKYIIKCDTREASTGCAWSWIFPSRWELRSKSMKSGSNTGTERKAPTSAFSANLIIAKMWWLACLCVCGAFYKALELGSGKSGNISKR